MAAERTKNAPQPGTVEGGAGAPRIRWDDALMQSVYANFCNVASTREEVVLLFGINHAWHTGQQEIPIQLTNRIIMNPYVVKRMAILLDNVLREHEARFGALSDSRT